MALPASVIEPIARFSGNAVFIGGTSGIGRATALQLAQNAGQKCSITLVGRNRQRAEEAIALMRQKQKVEHTYAFESCDVTSFANVRKLAATLREQLNRLNILVMTCGFLSFKGRDENNEVEKTDRKMMANLYSRMLFVRELLPLLEKAKAAVEEARVVSILDPVYGPGKLDWDDLELKRTYGLAKCAKHCCTMNNVALEDFALQAPEVSFIHANPGFVDTSVGDAFPFGIRHLAKGLAAIIATKDHVYAARLLTALFDPRFAKGDWRLDQYSEPTTKSKGESGEEARRKVVAHIREVTSRGASGR